MKLNELGLLLIMAVSNNTQKNKDIFLANIEKHKKTVMNNNEIVQKQKDLYLVNYEQKRNENSTNYEEYTHNRLLLFNKWKTTNKLQDLQLLINCPKPDFYEVDDIYTYNLIKSKLK
jgi:hypothetical protein